MKNIFSISEILKTAWDITRKNILVIFGYSAAAFVSLGLLQLVFIFVSSLGNSFFNFLGLTIVLIGNSIATLGFYKLTFKLIDDNEAEDFDFKTIFPSWKNISSFISITILLGFVVSTITLIYTQLLRINTFKLFINNAVETPYLMAALAFFAFIIFVLAVMRFMFFPCFIVDDNSSSLHSLRQSRELTYGNITHILTILLLVIGFIAVGFLCFGVGVIVTYPFTNIVLVVTYRKLVYSYGVQHNDKQIIT
ncbi:MAG: hypothetical protein EAZ51_08370 [Sphingobacteriales bacterium]|nr:MAG: hypothetical protein EAZ64_08585 [Sphingobacteriales bacterium]TAF79035.1 MAG: hypothetical protein EAZ51_08370 [Sphingobacteriales bacterium]